MQKGFEIAIVAIFFSLGVLELRARPGGHRARGAAHDHAAASDTGVRSRGAPGARRVAILTLSPHSARGNGAAGLALPRHSVFHDRPPPAPRPVNGPTRATSAALRGELVALAYLVSCGWVIEAHRFRLGRHDLDLIVRRHDVVAFVEVKTRRSRRYGAPGESIGWKKRRTIARVAGIWALRNGRWGDTFRFDVVEVLDRAGGRRRCITSRMRGGWTSDCPSDSK